jgi:hypothetical protein
MKGSRRIPAINPTTNFSFSAKVMRLISRGSAELELEDLKAKVREIQLEPLGQFIELLEVEIPDHAGLLSPNVFRL